MRRSFGGETRSNGNQGGKIDSPHPELIIRVPLREREMTQTTPLKESRHHQIQKYSLGEVQVLHNTRDPDIRQVMLHFLTAQPCSCAARPMELPRGTPAVHKNNAARPHPTPLSLDVRLREMIVTATRESNIIQHQWFYLSSISLTE